jgi:hypothetical protein
MTSPAPRDGERPALEDIAHSVRGAAQLVKFIAQASNTPASIRAGLELISSTLEQSAEKADALIDEVGINISDHLGITTSDLASMHFAPVSPAFKRQPDSIGLWKQDAEAEFDLWGQVETILAQDDAGLERRFVANPDEHVAAVDALEKLRERWQGGIKLMEATLLRLAVAIARWEQSDGR